MNKIAILSDTVKNINTTCDAIMRATLKGVQAAASKGAPKEKLHSIAETLIKDAKQVKAELPILIDEILKGENSVFSDTPFMRDVWLGDAYGVSGLESLNELLNDLKEQLKNCTSEKILEMIK